MGDPSKQTLQRTKRETLQAGGASLLSQWIADPIGMAQDALPAKPLARKIASGQPKKWSRLEQDALSYLRMVKEGKAMEADRSFGNLADIKNLIAERGWATEGEMRAAYLVERGQADAGRETVADRSTFRGQDPNDSGGDGLFSESGNTEPTEKPMAQKPVFSYSEKGSDKSTARYEQMLSDLGDLQKKDGSKENSPEDFTNAVKKFQKRKGLEVNGILDKRTTQALQNEAG